MVKAIKYSILVLRGESIKDSPLADKVIDLDRKNMEVVLKAIGREFPESKRRVTLFHPSNQMIIAKQAQEVVGYVDYCDDLANPHDLYLSSIQIEAAHRGGTFFKLLLSNLLIQLRSRTFGTIKTNIQKSNIQMIAIAKKLGLTVEENPANPGTLSVFAKREILSSPKLNRLFGTK